MGAAQLNRFDRIAPFYDWLASFVFGSSLVNAQEQHLDSITDYSDVLVLGGGTGKFLSKLLDKNNGCRVWFVEASQKMIDLAKRNLENSDRVVFIHGTHENLPDQKFDVVITHFFVDMFTESELNVITQQVQGHLKSEGLWFVADFVQRKYWHRIALKAMYLFFNAIRALDLNELPDWDRIIQSKYFKKTSVRSFYGSFIDSAAYSKR
ncbi:MAG: class I SAM-dependent methyltransferase [Cyclobacteriaceae bacterium]